MDACIRVFLKSLHCVGTYTKETKIHEVLLFPALLNTAVLALLVDDKPIYFEPELVSGLLKQK